MNINLVSDKNVFSKKRLIILIIFLISVVAYFWTQSRYPALNTKAAMSDHTNTIGLSFDIWYPILEKANLIERVKANTLNWYYTNWKGMSFGLVLSVILLSILQGCIFRLPKKLDSFLGSSFGAALGLCANCSTPVGTALYTGGMSRIFSLSLIMGSPTLNIVVLGILFSTFPFYIAMSKLLLSLAVILLIIPALNKKEKQCENLQFEKKNEWVNEDWLRAFWGVILTFFVNLLAICRQTVPFMLLAGLTGALIIEIIPIESLSSLQMSLGNIILVAIVGTLLPVPMSFDVIIVQFLYAAGMPLGLAAILLFTLGIFSIYTFFILFKYFSKKLAMSIFVTIFVIGCVYGTTVFIYDNFLIAQIKNNLSSTSSLEILKNIDQSCSAIKDKLGVSYKKDDCARAIALQIVGLVDDTICEDLAETLTDNIDKKDFLNDCSQKVLREKAIDNIDTCKSQKDPVGCIKSAILYKAERDIIDNSIACSSTGMVDAKKFCSESNMAFKAIFKKSIDSCNSLKSSEWRRFCLSQINNTESRTQKSPRIIQSKILKNCGYLKNIDERNSCLSDSLAMHGTQTRKMDVCKLLPLSEQQICEQKYIDLSLQKDEHSLNCNDFEKDEHKKYCYEMVEAARVKSQITEYLLKNASKPSENFANNFVSDEPAGIAGLENFPIKSNIFYEKNNIVIYEFQHRKRNTTSAKVFSEVSRSKTQITGLDEKGFTNFFNRLSLSTADLNNDFWPDLVGTDFNNLSVYINQGGKSFERIALALDQQAWLGAYSVAIADINNDGWNDIFFSSQSGSNYYLLNDQKLFQNSKIEVWQNPNRGFTTNFTFADINHDSFLDVYFGNWTGNSGPFFDLTSKNELYTQKDGRFSLNEDLADSFGPTHSVLFSDFNGDGWSDLLVANDFSSPDNIFINEKGFLRHLLKSDKIISNTAWSNMSYDTGDIDNDLKLEIFSTDMTFGETEKESYCEIFTNDKEKFNCAELFKIYKAELNHDIRLCEKVSLQNYKDFCVRNVIREIAKTSKNDKLCTFLNKKSWEYSACMKQVLRKNTQRYFEKEDIPQKQQTNVLLKQDEQGRFQDVTKEFKVSSSYWSWTSRFADLDNDGWLDIYVVNGDRPQSEIHPNIFFHNQKGKYFVQAQKEFGLDDFLHSQAYSYVDYDLDGDLDIILSSRFSPMRVFNNSESKNSTISFQFNDMRGNRKGIGCKIIISYKNSKNQMQHQMRELKLGGGVSSSDAPVIHFGLGSEKAINNLKIIWSTGEVTEVDRVFPAEHQYIINRM